MGRVIQKGHASERKKLGHIRVSRVGSAAEAISPCNYTFALKSKCCDGNGNAKKAIG